MKSGSNQKLKLLYLMKIFLEKTDENHGLTMSEILASLKAYDIPAERKTIYADIEALRFFGLDIISVPKGRSCYYHVASRDFELAELKLLVDSVQSAKFITEKKSHSLIKKIESLTSQHEAKQLQRQVYVRGRNKTNNENIFYNVDFIHTAIATDVQVRFQYFQWNVKKERELRHGGKWYQISPWALTWDDENYYMMGFDSEVSRIKHYRVDKMLSLELTEERREGKECFEQSDMVSYTKKLFGMFDGEEKRVRMEFKNELAGVVIDRFGSDVPMAATDENHFEARVNVAVSGQFLGWIMALGDGVRIVEPEDVAEKMKEKIRELMNIYHMNE